MRGCSVSTLRAPRAQQVRCTDASGDCDAARLQAAAFEEVAKDLRKNLKEDGSSHRAALGAAKYGLQLLDAGHVRGQQAHCVLDFVAALAKVIADTHCAT